jgi:hypothetical protein
MATMDFTTKPLMLVSYWMRSWAQFNIINRDHVQNRCEEISKTRSLLPGSAFDGDKLDMINVV